MIIEIFYDMPQDPKELKELIDLLETRPVQIDEEVHQDKEVVVMSDVVILRVKVKDRWRILYDVPQGQDP